MLIIEDQLIPYQTLEKLQLETCIHLPMHLRPEIPAKQYTFQKSDTHTAIGPVVALATLEPSSSSIALSLAVGIYKKPVD